MSNRYRPDPRSSGGDLAYRDAPPQRWDANRYSQERDNRGPPRRAPVYEQDRIYEEERYNPRTQRVERRYVEEDDFYYRDPRAAGGAMIPFRPGRPEAPPRPGIIRRQSSLDTFDRRPNRRYDDYDDYGPPRIPVPIPQSPPRRRPTRYDEQTYDDIRIQEPDAFGDDTFREYREREWITQRRRDSSRSRSRSQDRLRGEKPYPRKGKTRMPKRLVHTKVLYDLGYPFYEEDERTILVEQALGPENIDQVLTMSKEYRERETITTRLIEAPTFEQRVVPPSGSIREERISERVETLPISDAPRSVREWDALSVRSPSPKSHRSRSRRRSHRGGSPGTVRESIIEKKIIERESSPARSAKTSTTRRRSSSSDSETIVERTKIVEREDFDESGSVHIGPLALVVDRKPSRTDRDIQSEIRQLERERRALRKERKSERESTEIVKVERIRERSPSPRGEVIIERRGEEVVEVRKDRRGRSRSAAPNPALIKAMMATLT